MNSVNAGGVSARVDFELARWPQLVIRPTEDPADWSGVSALAIPVDNPTIEPIDLVIRVDDGPDADGIFLSCTNTTQIEAIADIERLLGKPVVNSNQAVLWGCVKRLKAALAPLPPMPALGRLMRHLDA